MVAKMSISIFQQASKRFFCQWYGNEKFSLVAFRTDYERLIYIHTKNAAINLQMETQYRIKCVFKFKGTPTLHYTE